MLCMCQYDSRVAGGEGSRVEIDLEKLKAAGWNVEKSGKSYIMESPPPAKKRFRSTKEVAEFLKSEDDFLPSLGAVVVHQQLQRKNQASRMKTRTTATALIQKKKEECPVTLRTHQEK